MGHTLVISNMFFSYAVLTGHRGSYGSRPLGEESPQSILQKVDLIESMPEVVTISISFNAKDGQRNMKTRKNSFTNDITAPRDLRFPSASTVSQSWTCVWHRLINIMPLGCTDCVVMELKWMLASVDFLAICDLFSRSWLEKQQVQPSEIHWCRYTPEIHPPPPSTPHHSK